MYTVLEVLHGACQVRPNERQCEPKTWDELVKLATSILSQTVEVHQKRCETGNIQLVPIYEDRLAGAVKVIGRMAQISPEFAACLKQGLHDGVADVIAQETILLDLLHDIERL